MNKVQENPIICPHCGQPCGLSNPFLMVIYPPGFKCRNCGKIAIRAHGYVDPPPKPKIDEDYRPWTNPYKNKKYPFWYTSRSNGVFNV